MDVRRRYLQKANNHNHRLVDVTLGHLGHLPVTRVVEGQVGLGFDLGEEKQSYVLRKNFFSNLIKEKRTELDFEEKFTNLNVKPDQAALQVARQPRQVLLLPSQVESPEMCLLYS